MRQNLVDSFKAVINNLNTMTGMDLYKSEARALLTGMSTMLDNIVIDANDERYLRHHINGLLEHEGLAEAELHAMLCGEYDVYCPESYEFNEELPF